MSAPGRKVVTWREELSEAFERLNREWIEADFVVEAGDLAVFRDPYGTIVAPGGQIFFVMHDGVAVATCAIIPQADGDFELAKMAVTATARQHGYGNMLASLAIEHARRAGARGVVLVSSRKLVAARRLYDRLGFREVPLGADTNYARADVRMRLPLGPEPDRKPSGAGQGPADQIE
jgi:ribosomal protein S18 acetylase RimI-like enzyme